MSRLARHKLGDSHVVSSSVVVVVVVVMVVVVVVVAVIALVVIREILSGVTRMAHHQSSDGLELSPRWKCFSLGGRFLRLSWVVVSNSFYFHPCLGK